MGLNWRGGLSNTSEQSVGGTGPSAEDRSVRRSPTDREIDLQALAERVYQLLKRELGIERERSGWDRL